MKRIHFSVAAGLSALSLVILLVRPAVSQIQILPAFVRLQATTPGTSQAGHSNITGTAIAGQFQGGGAALTGLDASNIASGVLSDTRLSTNVALLDQAQTFSASKTFSGGISTGSFKMSTGAASGRVLTTDASGVGTWQDPSSTGQTSRVYRWNVFNTYDLNTGPTMNNDPSLFGGVSPLQWTDSSAVAAMISPSLSVQRALFTQRATFGPNAMVYCETFTQPTSTDGRVVVCLFRVRNTTGSNITWTPNFRYTAYSSWGEVASCALNGSSAFVNGVPGTTSVSLSIPFGVTSTVIFVATSGPPAQVGANLIYRSTQMAFVNNSLTLPQGLEFVDDFDTAQ